jgi:hypothetical protein
MMLVITTTSFQLSVKKREKERSKESAFKQPDWKVVRLDVKLVCCVFCSFTEGATINKLDCWCMRALGISSTIVGGNSRRKYTRLYEKRHEAESGRKG